MSDLNRAAELFEAAVPISLRGAMGTLPTDGLNPTTPQKLAG